MMSFGNRKIILLILSLLCVVFISHSLQWYEKGNPHFINESEYKRLVSNPLTRENGTVILKFFTPWCRYCRYLKDIIDNLFSKQKWAIKVYEVNCDSENHDFCLNMGVRSYPKMIVFVDGQFKESMDGFYPYHVVRELFIKYNHPTQSEEQKKQIVQEKEAKIIKQESHQLENKQHSQKQFEKHEENQQKQQKKQHSTQQQKINQQYQQPPPQPQKNLNNNPQPNYIEPQVVKPLDQQKENNKDKKVKDNSHPKTAQQPHTASPNHDSTQSQPVIQEQQNIVIMDGYKQATQQQKHIIQGIEKNKQSIEVINVTKILTDHLQNHNYGRYLLYIISIIIGAYYFMHIMKAQPQMDSKHQEGKNTITIQHINLNPMDSIHQQSSDSKKIHYQVNQQQVGINQIEIRDEDL